MALALDASTDFVQEARNSEKTANNFKNNKWVKVPRVFWVRTLEFCKIIVILLSNGHTLVRDLCLVKHMTNYNMWPGLDNKSGSDDGILQGTKGMTCRT